MAVNWGPIITAAISGGGLGWATTFISNMTNSRAYTMGAVDASVKTALDSTRQEIERLSAAHKTCCEENEKMRAELHELRDHIDQLMKGAVPGYVIGPAKSLD